MKIETFLTLRAVLDTGTLAGAARVLHLTPSAVSMQIKQLEVYVGQQLFDRSGLEVKPLPAAYELSETMQGMLEKLEAFRRQTTIVIEGHLKIGIIESMQPVLLPYLLRSIKTRYPRLHLQIRRGKSSELTQAVKAGELDAALVAQPGRGGSSRMHWHPLLRQELSLIVPPGEREQSLAVLLKRYEWIRYDRSTITGGLAARYISSRFRDQHSSIELDGVRAIAALVSVGLGLSIVQLLEPGISSVYPITVVPLPDAPTLQFSMVTRKSDVDSRQLSALRELLSAAVAAR